MSFIQPWLSSRSNSSFDESRWVIQIRRTLDNELEDDGDNVPVCIFSVPRALMASNPDLYAPQQVAIGPYHYWRLELYEMERYKLAAAKRTQKQLQGLKFQHLVEHLIKLEQKIRAGYHKYLDFNGETLAWRMAIDGSFLLEFLYVYAISQGKVISRVSTRMSHLVDYTGMKSAHNVILRDIIMLENQIPLFVLRKMLELQCSSIESSDDLLLSMLLGLYKEISPFKFIENLPKIEVSDCFHLLDFLYRMITPETEGPAEIIDVDEDHTETAQIKEETSNYCKKISSVIWKLLLKLNGGPASFIKRVLLSGPVKVILKWPWQILSNLPGFAIFKQPVEYLFFSQDKEDNSKGNRNSSSNGNISRPPLLEEITIPSVTELSNSGIRFVSTNGGILTITFDVKAVTLYLPTVSLDVNTEVILRNLVAYEALNATGPLVFTRYTELMNGIIDTVEDVKVLRENGIILNHLKSDEEVCNMWNGMSKSIRLTKVSYLDKVIEDVNKHYNGSWKVKATKFFQKYVYGSWPLLTLFAAILFLFLMVIQAFCSVYSCSRIFHVDMA